MNDKISLASCNGMSKFGLISRVLASDLSEEIPNIISICIPSTAASNYAPSLLNKYPVIALNGCSNSCVNKILKNKNIDVYKSIDIMELAEKNSLKPGKVARLGETGEETVKKLKEIIKDEF
ncbi:putative zinc-binding protein [Methanobrevibacter sp. DSM 116169]|uniref:putative zinc-binding protein n=1 Tax=Methanobrevibacter sp. DSM 116169 TaxID=3242727 RepID=UPI0038FD0ACD